ncbi:hypothetical protein IWW55_001222, partial [Coemansia sp. RSA 2706]
AAADLAVPGAAAVPGAGPRVGAVPVHLRDGAGQRRVRGSVGRGSQRGVRRHARPQRHALSAGPPGVCRRRRGAGAAGEDRRAAAAVQAEPAADDAVSGDGAAAGHYERKERGVCAVPAVCQAADLRAEHGSAAGNGPGREEAEGGRVVCGRGRRLSPPSESAL